MCQSWVCNTNLSNQLAKDQRSCVLVSYCILICVSPGFVIYLENINLILAFIINIISQPIELLNISSAFIV